MSSKIFSILIVLALVPSATVFAQSTDDAPASTDGKGDTILLRQAGVGGAVGNYEGNNQWSVSLQSNLGQMGNGGQTGKAGGDNQVYSFGQANIDVGPAGISFGATTHMGKNFITRDNNQTIVPVLGIEPLNFSTGSSIGFDGGSFPHRVLGHDPYFELTPMGSAGFQLFTDSCQAMVLARAGFALGSEGTSNDAPVGLAAAYGVGVSAMCRDLFLFDANATRLNNGQNVVDEANVMAAIQIPGTKVSVGVDLDGRSTKSLAQTNVVYSLPVNQGPTTEMTAKGVVGIVF